MGEAKRKSRNRVDVLGNEPRCVYCGNPPVTKEHMPPITFFRGRSRPSGMEFAACASCNNGTKTADLVVSFLARMNQTDNPEMAAEASALARRIARVAPGIGREFTRPDKTARKWVKTQAGLYMPVQLLNLDGPHTRGYLTVFAAKLAMALYREHLGEPLPLGGGVHVMAFLNAGLPQKTGDFILSKLPVRGTLVQGKFMVPDQFAYGFNTDGKTILAAMGKLQFEPAHIHGWSVRPEHLSAPDRSHE